MFNFQTLLEVVIELVVNWNWKEIFPPRVDELLEILIDKTPLETTFISDDLITDK